MIPVTITRVNLLTTEAFVAAFGDIAEASSWVARDAERMRPYRTRESMIAAFTKAVVAARREQQLDLLRAHPDLGGRAAIAGQLLPESRSEQAGVGLDRLTPEEFARFADINARYRTRFGIPFILAVKGATKEAILASFDARIGNDLEMEIANALLQVQRIMRFRLEDRISP